MIIARGRAESIQYRIRGVAGRPRHLPQHTAWFHSRWNKPHSLTAAVRQGPAGHAAPGARSKPSRRRGGWVAAAGTETASTGHDRQQARLGACRGQRAWVECRFALFVREAGDGLGSRS